MRGAVEPRVRRSPLPRALPGALPVREVRANTVSHHRSRRRTSLRHSQQRPHHRLTQTRAHSGRRAKAADRSAALLAYQITVH